MSITFPPSLITSIEQSGVIAVLVIDRIQDALPVAEALKAGGITAIELTLRTAAGVDAIREIKKHLPDLLVGAGTVLTPDQVRKVKDAGADFAVSPGVNHRVLSTAESTGIPFAPGISTPSDIEAALEHGSNLLKLFPAEPVGGLKYLKAIAAPYAHLGLKYIPLGGLNEENMRPYFADKSIAAIGGSWLAKRDVIQAGNWTEITVRARQANEAARQART